MVNMTLEFHNSVQNPRITQYILVFYPSGQRKAVQITDPTLGICPFGASEKPFKFIPDEFVASNRI
jgi:hypothetical protein